MNRLSEGIRRVLKFCVPRTLAPWVLLLAACNHPSSSKIILISLDTCRADALGVLSGDRPSSTPHLDAFATDAVVFENAFAQIPHTLPSHMSMFTSVYPDVHGVKPDLDVLPESLLTLPQILHDAGYRTIGRVTSDWLKPDFGFGRGFDDYELLDAGLTFAPRVNEAALERLDAVRADGQPLFLFLHYYDLHSEYGAGPGTSKLPYYSPPAYRTGLGVSEDGKEFCDAEGNCGISYLIASDVGRRKLPADELETIHALYRAGVRYLDDQLGILFTALKERGLYTDSLILITSDHGEEFREHGRFIHSQPYDETLHVPLLIKFPQSWKAGTRVPDVVQTVDILPSLLDYLGLESPAYAQGKSFLDRIRGGARPQEWVLAQDTVDKLRYAVRSDRMKLIVDLEKARRELYDLAADPKERVNLIAHRPEATAQLETRLKNLLRANRALRAHLVGTGKEGEDLLTAQERERLRSLGYLD